MANRIFIHSYGDSFKSELLTILVNHTLLTEIHKIHETKNRVIFVDNLSEKDLKYISSFSDELTKTICVRNGFKKNKN